MTTEQTNMESAPNEGAGTPNPASPASGQPSSAGATGEVSNQELIKRLEKLEKLEQSAKDRAIDQLRKDFEAKFAEISGKPAAEQKPETAAAPPTTGTVGSAQAIPEALDRFKETGLSVSDPDISALIGDVGKYGTRETFLLEAERLINRKLIKPSVSTGAVIPPASPPPTPPGLEELKREYREKVIANRGNKAAIEAIKADYAKKGVPVDSMVWTIK